METSQQQESVCSVKWKESLASNRNLAVFFWRALTFQQNIIAGLAVWFVVHISLWLLLSQDASVLYVTGNFLLLISLAVVLCSVAASYGNLTCTEWTERDEHTFNGMCVKLAELEHSLRVLWNVVVLSRQTKPLKFYACGMVVAGLVITLDHVVSLAIVLQCLVFCLLLLPLGLHKGLLWRFSDEDVNILVSRVEQWMLALVTRAKQSVLQLHRSIRKH